MKLEKIVQEEGELQDLLKKADHGDKITLYEGHFDSWDVHYDNLDVFTRRFGSIYKGEEMVATEVEGSWSTFGKGFVLIEGGSFRPGKIVDSSKSTPLYEGRFEDWCEYKGGVAVTHEKKVLADGKPIYEDPCLVGIRYHPGGLLVEQGGRRRKDRKLLLLGTEEEWLIESDWTFVGHEKGIVVHKDYGFFLNNRKMHDDWCNGWTANKYGIILQQKQRIVLVVLKTD